MLVDGRTGMEEHAMSRGPFRSKGLFFRLETSQSGLIKRVSRNERAKGKTRKKKSIKGGMQS